MGAKILVAKASHHQGSCPASSGNATHRAVGAVLAPKERTRHREVDGSVESPGSAGPSALSSPMRVTPQKVHPLTQGVPPASSHPRGADKALSDSISAALPATRQSSANTKSLSWLALDTMAQPKAPSIGAAEDPCGTPRTGQTTRGFPTPGCHSTPNSPGVAWGGSVTSTARPRKC